jgi:hypothetical protein
MTMKRNLIILIATLPVLGIAWHLFNGGSQKSPLPAASATTNTQPKMGGNSATVDKTPRSSSGTSYQPSNRELAQDQLTQRHHDSAQEAMKLKPSDFGKNGDFLLKKYQALFDSWGLSTQERNQFVAVVTEDGVRMAEVFLEKTKTWPLQVGHVANKKADLEHSNKANEAIRKVQEETKLKLTALVGADRVAEYEKHRKGGATEIKD